MAKKNLINAHTIAEYVKSYAPAPDDTTITERRHHYAYRSNGTLIQKSSVHYAPDPNGYSLKAKKGYWHDWGWTKIMQPISQITDELTFRDWCEAHNFTRVL